MRQRLPLFAAALWWGSLSVVGFLVVPLLFAHLPTPALAGGMAAKLFSAQTWLGLACGVLLLMLSRDARAGLTQAVVGLILAGLLLALLSELAVAPRIMARENLALWHRVGSAMYVAQWLCVSAVLWKLAGRRQP